MKTYTFLDENEEIITEVEAENHDEAIKKAQFKECLVNWSTDFTVQSDPETPWEDLDENEQEQRIENSFGY